MYLGNNDIALQRNFKSKIEDLSLRRIVPTPNCPTSTELSAQIHTRTPKYMQTYRVAQKSWTPLSSLHG